MFNDYFIENFVECDTVTDALLAHAYHMPKPAYNLLSLSIIHAVLPSSGSNLFVCYSIHPGNAQDTPLPSMMSGVQSFRQCCC